MKTNIKTNKSVVTDANNKNISTSDKAYGYGALLVLCAGTGYASSVIADANKVIIEASGIIIVLFALKLICRLLK